MNKGVEKGTISLIISGFLCKIIGALFRLPLTNIIGLKGIGIFQMIMSIYSLLLIIVSSGVTNSLSKLVSSSRADSKFGKIHSYLKEAITFSLISGLFISILIVIFSKQIASFQGISEGYSSYLLFIFLLPLGGLIGVYRGIIQGYENMTPTAISQIIEQTTKFSLGLLLAYMLGRNSLSQGVLGAFLGITISEVIAFVYLFFSSKKIKMPVDDNLKLRKEFYHALLPLTFSNAIIPFSNAIESTFILSLLVVSGIGKDVGAVLFGLESGVVGAVLHFPLIISLSFSVALLPKISFLNQACDIQNQKETIQKSFRVMWFFLLPLTFGIVALSKEVFPIIYPSLLNGYLDTVLNLTLIGSFGVVLLALQQYFVMLVQAKGYFTASMIFTIIGAAVKLLLLFLLARNAAINIYAIPISNAIMSGVISILCLTKLTDVVKIDFFDLVLPLLASLIMFLSVRVLISFVGGIAGTIISVILGGAVYFAACLPITLIIFKDFFIKLKTKRRNIC